VMLVRNYQKPSFKRDFGHYPFRKVEGFADVYDRFRPNPPSELLNLLPKLVKNPKSLTVVDLGCGTGLSTRFWSQTASTIYGVEPSDDMRSPAEKQNTDSKIRYLKAYAHETGLPNSIAQIVTCSQSLHWMDPKTTFPEIKRILTKGGVFAAYDYDWPPTTPYWEIDYEWEILEKKIRSLGNKHQLTKYVDDQKLKKEEHLQRMKESECFRYVKEILLHDYSKGNPQDLYGLCESQAHVQAVLNKFSKEEAGFEEFMQKVSRMKGQEIFPWLWSYRVRIGIV